MNVRELQRALEAALTGRDDTVEVVFTDVPTSETVIIDFLDAAVGVAARHGKALAEIELPMARFPAMGANFWHVPVVDSGVRDILRLNYEAATLAA